LCIHHCKACHDTKGSERLGSTYTSMAENTSLNFLKIIMTLYKTKPALNIINKFKEYYLPSHNQAVDKPITGFI